MGIHLHRERQYWGSIKLYICTSWENTGTQTIWKGVFQYVAEIEVLILRCDLTAQSIPMFLTQLITKLILTTLLTSMHLKVRVYIQSVRVKP